jgi:ribosomal protein L24E
MAMGLSSFYGTQIAAAESFLAAEQNHDGGFTTAVGTTTGSNLRASTQAVNGVVGTSFGTLSDPLTGPTPPAPPAASLTTPSATSGYWEAASDGGIFSFGTAQFYGSMGGKALNAPVVGIAATPNGQGYWEVASDGGIFAFGTAQFYGSEGGQRLNAPIVGIAPTPDGKGYWEVGADGGVYAFGDAAFYGSTGAMTLNAPIVGMTATPTGKGYWEVASDGGIYAFGTAQFYGSMGGTSLDKPVVAIASTPNGQGYWEVAADGGVFSFGDAGFSGSLPTQGVHVSDVVSVAPTVDGQGAAPNGAASGGYWEAAADGGVFSFGDATFYGSMGGKPLNAPIVGITATGSS